MRAGQSESGEPRRLLLFFFYREGPGSFAATSKALRREQTAEWASHSFGDSSKGGVHTLKSFAAVVGTVKCDERAVWATLNQSHNFGDSLKGAVH